MLNFNRWSLIVDRWSEAQCHKWTVRRLHSMWGRVDVATYIYKDARWPRPASRRPTCSHPHNLNESWRGGGKTRPRLLHFEMRQIRAAHKASRSLARCYLSRITIGPDRPAAYWSIQGCSMVMFIHKMLACPPPRPPRRRAAVVFLHKRTLGRCSRLRRCFQLSARTLGLCVSEHREI